MTQRQESTPEHLFAGAESLLDVALKELDRGNIRDAGCGNDADVRPVGAGTRPAEPAAGAPSEDIPAEEEGEEERPVEVAVTTDGEAGTPPSEIAVARPTPRRTRKKKG